MEKKHIEEPEVKVVLKEEQHEQDPLECLICSVLNAFGLHKNAFKDYKQDRLKDLLGGTISITIDMDSPYEEEDFEDLLKDVFHMIKEDDEYDDEKIKMIRESKKNQGKSLKKLLSLLDDEHMLKTFKVIQMHKKGGSIKEKTTQNNEKTRIKNAITGEFVTIPEDLSKEQLNGKLPVQTVEGDEGYIIENKFLSKKYINHPIGLKKENGGDIEGKEIDIKAEEPKEEIKEEKLPKEDQIEVKIGDNIYFLWEAKSEEEKTKGLQGITSLDENEGMIFYYDKPQHVEYWMKDCEIDLLIAFFDEDYECISVKKGKAMSEQLIPEDNVMFVIELDPNADVKPGDYIDFVNKDEDEYVMHVLGTDGDIQYSLKSGQRIFSRVSTKVIIKKSKRAYKNKDNERYDSYCKSLGKYVFKELDAQDGRDEEYVQLDKKED